MASFWSTYLKDKINDHLHGGPSFTAPGTTYFNLMNAAPTPSGGGTPVTAISRLAVTNNSTNWPASSSGLKSNGTVMTFTSSAPSDLGTIVGIAEYDSASGGNLLTYGDLTPTSKACPLGSAFTVAINGGQFSYIDAP
jgi:hypothetical protein